MKLFKSFYNTYILFLITAIMLVSAQIFAQTDGTTPAPFDPSVFWGKVGYYALLALGFYELIARLVPTVRSYSIVNNIVAVLNFLFPDKKANQFRQVTGTHFQKSELITADKIKVGDRVKTKDGIVFTVSKRTDTMAAGTIDNTNKQIQTPLTDIIEVIEKGYLLVDLVKWFIGFFKNLFGKKTPA